MALLKKIKLQIFYLRKAFFEHKAGWRYIYSRYFLSKRILRHPRSFEKPVNCNNLSMHCLTCHTDVVPLVWALASFYLYSKTIGDLYIHSDGTLNKKDISIFKRFFPSCRIIFPDDIFSNSYNFSSQPFLRDFRSSETKYVLLKKLVDPYFISDKELVLVVDSDVLWFKEPVEIEEEISRGAGSSIMMHISRRGCPVYFSDNTILDYQLSLYNSGIVLYNKSNFSLDKLSEYLKKIDLGDERNTHFIEQAGYAYCLDNVKTLPEDRYPAVGHLYDYNVVNHFTGPCRTLFYIEGVEKLKNFFIV